MAHILLVDDDGALREVLSLNLKMRGHEVTEASNGKEAIDAFTRRRPDLVITDIVMPEKEGLETILDLKRRDPSVKIIAMSGDGVMASKDSLQIARMFGVLHTLAKPFSNDELSVALSVALQDPRWKPA